MASLNVSSYRDFFDLVDILTRILNDIYLYVYIDSMGHMLLLCRKGMCYMMKVANRAQVAQWTRAISTEISSLHSSSSLPPLKSASSFSSFSQMTSAAPPSSSSSSSIFPLSPPSGTPSRATWTAKTSPSNSRRHQSPSSPSLSRAGSSATTSSSSSSLSSHMVNSGSTAVVSSSSSLSSTSSSSSTTKGVQCTSPLPKWEQELKPGRVVNSDCLQSIASSPQVDRRAPGPLHSPVSPSVSAAASAGHTTTTSPTLHPNSTSTSAYLTLSGGGLGGESKVEGFMMRWEETHGMREHWNR